MRTALQSFMSARLCITLAAALTASAGTASAATVIVQDGLVPPLWIATPDPLLFPTDFEAINGTGGYADTSRSLTWGSGVLPEPGPHSYTNGIITMANVFNRDHQKLVWLKMGFFTPDVNPQPAGQKLDLGQWPSASFLDILGLPKTGQVLAAGWTGSGSLKTLTMEFLLDPQPASETINTLPLFGGSWPTDSGTQPTYVSVQTICIPTPTGAAALGIIGGMLTMSRRRRATA